jgi:hypothetical protein
LFLLLPSWCVPMTPCWGPRCSQIWPFWCREPVPINDNWADRNGTS